MNPGSAKTLANVYAIDRDIKVAATKSRRLADRAGGCERDARHLAAEVHELERLSVDRGRQMNSRLASLYRRRARVGALGAIFSADTPGEVDRRHHFLKVMIDDDRQRVDAFVGGLREARARRVKLGQMVRRLVEAQRDARAAELVLNARRAEKTRLMATLARARDVDVAKLRSLRDDGVTTGLAFFERRGSLSGPVSGRITRDFGAVADQRFNFKLSHRGWFYGRARGAEVNAVADGRVTVAREVPGRGPTVVIDHGGHYHSVYSGTDRIKVREGDVVTAGATLAVTGHGSPLFGPGLYFELRHFADAIDPRKWIKDPDFSTTAVEPGVNE